MLKSLFAGITRTSMRLKWLTIALTIVFLVWGVASALQLNQEFLPSIEFPQSFIVTLRPGASAEDLRDLVTIPLEEEAAKIKGVLRAGMESTTTSPVSLVTVRNDYGPNQAKIREDLHAAIQKVIADGVPLGLRTTADLTPEIMQKVLKRAPSMWKHFEAQHFLAMPRQVFDAALEVNPDLINEVDLLTRDQLAARDVDVAVAGTPDQRRAVELPSAWRITDKETPRIITFSLNDIPITSASVFSTAAGTTPAQLRELVEKEVIPQLRRVKGVANVTLSGGQEIPPEVREAAAKAIAQAAAQGGGNGNTNSGPSSATPVAAKPAARNGSPVTEPAIPPLPASWRGLQFGFARPTLGMAISPVFNTAEDLLNVTDANGQDTKVADILNRLAANATYAAMVRELPPAVIGYLKEKEDGFEAGLNDKAMAALSAAAYARLKNEPTAPLLGGAWAQLATQAGFQKIMLESVRDLPRVKGSSAETINAVVKNTPAKLSTFAIRIAGSLSPEAVEYIVKHEPDFLAKLAPQALRYMNANALDKLKALSLDAWNALDKALRDDLEAIIKDPTKAPITALQDTGADAAADDPNAPVMPDSWKTLPGVNLQTASDLLKKPFGLGAGAFLNAAAANPQGSGIMKDLSAEILLYVAERDATFFKTLTPATLNLLSKETLAKLPSDLQDRAASGTVFLATTTITRTNSQPSLNVSFYKDSGSNTVRVSDAADEVFRDIEKKHPEIKFSTVFEQAGFVKESIEGVAREGSLGALAAIFVIFMFLNFSVRSTLVTAVSIPTSLAIAFVLMRWLPSSVNSLLTQPSVASALPEGVLTFLLRLFPAGLTLNIMTLSGLTVAIGRVVDDAIVVLENIYRQLQKGTDPRAAVIQGVRDVSVAIFAATLTTVVVFLPIGLAGGVVGEFFLPFGLAVTYALMASFIVAVTIVPLLAFMFIDQKHLPEEKEGRLASLYHRTIEWSLSHRWAVMGAAAVTLVIGMALFATRPTTFLPSLGDPQISVAVTMPQGTAIAQTDARVRQFEEYVNTLSGRGVEKYATVIGSGGGFESILGVGGGVNGSAGQLTLVVNAKDEALNQLTADVRAKAEAVFGKKNVRVSKASISEQGFGGFSVVVSGPEAELAKLNAKVKETLSKVPGLTNVSSTADQLGGAGSAAYLRVGLTAAMQFSGELETQNTLGVTRDAIQAVKAMPDLPSSVSVGEGFQSQQQTEGFAQIFSAMGVAVAAVYIVMVITFGSLIHPFTILFSLPLAVVGAALLMTLTNRVLGISAMVGMLMLIGIVVTNAIVLIDRVQANRKERGMATREALIEGGRTRLRPILMTAIATMVALTPLALGLSKGAIIATELGTVVIGGLFSSTLLTLLVVPIIYSLFDAAQRRIFGGGKVKPDAAAGD